jgi:8-oxo-dGTP pyrophosphatase MutT (NUDIX family)
MKIIETIRETLKNRAPLSVDNSDQSLIHAAVLMPIFCDNGNYMVLFTERTHKVEHHKGQISFPGGSVEKKDRSLVETALRETYEEVGIHNRDVKVLGQIDDELTIASNFIVHTFVGTFPYPYEFELNHDEVESIINIPLEIFFMENSEYRRDSIEFDTFTYEGPVFIYEDVTIWGATARIMDRFVNLFKESLGLPQHRE